MTGRLLSKWRPGRWARRLALGLGCAVALAGGLLWWRAPPPLPDEMPLIAPGPLQAQRPAAVYHLGHSLTGRDMPAMLAQMMGQGYRYNLQLGWGASLSQHWRGDVPGFEVENATPAYRAARPALESGEYDAVVLTEMVELRAALRWHDSAQALADWARLARGARPGVRLYLYETWHRLDDPEGWLARIDTDRGALWERRLLARAMAEPGVGAVHVIPGGQVLAALVRRIEAGGVPGLSRREDLFARAADGTVDAIHLNDLGAYVIALTHYAVLTGQSPLGLPHALTRADGSAATAPQPEAARIMQQVVWQVVTGYALTGVSHSG